MLGRVPIPVLSGPNRGRLWSLASAGRGYVTGRFEADRLASMMALLRPGDRVWDIGAHKGYVSLAAARRVGRAGEVVAFEPSRENLDLLRLHRRWNRPGNLEVVPWAVGGESGRMRFGGGGSSITYRLGRGDEEVEVRTIRDLVEREGRRLPTVVKIDVEGEETGVLDGAGEHLRAVELLFVAVHGPDVCRDCLERLEASGFEVAAAGIVRRAVAGEADWYGDPDLVAWSPDRGLDPERVRSLPAWA